MNSRIGWWAAVLLACIIPALPLLVTEIPPITDYPNHLARMLFLGTRTNDPAMSAMLAPSWTLLPNLGTDAVLPWIMRAVPVHIAGRGMLAIILILPVLGALALNQATFGRGPSSNRAWPLGAALVTCHALFLLGFLNFNLGVGLAMLAAAIWFQWRETHPAATMAAAIIAACILFFCHLLAVAFFLLLIGACEIERCCTDRAVIRRGSLLALVALAPAALYMSTALHQAGGPTLWASLEVKAAFALYPVLNYSPWLDAATAAFIAAVVIAGIATRRLAIPIRWRVILLTLLLLFAIAPVSGKGLAYIDARFSVLLAFATFAGMRPTNLPTRLFPALATAAALILIARTALVGTLWHVYGTEVADIRAVIVPVQPGTRVLPVWGDMKPPGLSPRLLADTTIADWHIPALVMLDRRAFWPYLFASSGQQPIVWRPPFAELARDTPRPVQPDMLEGKETPEFPIWRTWQERYDYVLLIDPAKTVKPEIVGAGWLEPLAHHGMATLFHIKPRRTPES